jgi:hypothetical protein
MTLSKKMEMNIKNFAQVSMEEIARYILGEERERVNRQIQSLFLQLTETLNGVRREG